MHSTRSVAKGLSRAFTRAPSHRLPEDHLPPAGADDQLQPLRAVAGLRDRLQRPNEGNEPPGKAVRLRRQDELEGALAAAPGHVEVLGLDHLHVGGALAARVPEQAHLDPLDGLVEPPGDGAGDRLPRREVAAIAVELDLDQVHSCPPLSLSDAARGALGSFTSDGSGAAEREVAKPGDIGATSSTYSSFTSGQPAM